MKRDIRLELNRFKIEDILMEISNLSAEILISKNDENLKMNNAKLFSYRYEFLKGKYKKMSFIITNWTLVDMAYYAIKNVSDAFTKYPFDREEFLKLIHLYISYENQTNHPKGNDDLIMYLYGFLGEQNIFQSLHKVKENYCREMYILEKMNNEAHVDEIILAEIGVDRSKLPLILYYLFLISMYTKNVMNYSTRLKGIEKIEIEKVVNYYSETIDYIKNSPLKRQQLYSSPFIREAYAFTFPVNVYLIYHTFQNCIFWAVRNYYRKKNSQLFTNAFGGIFENYVKEIISEYVGIESFSCISVADNSRADFYLRLGQNDFIIEVKSSLAGLLAKQQESDVNAIKSFIDRTLIEAVNQLKSTEENCYPEGKSIKIILVYEDYFKSELLEMALKRHSIVDDGTYWLININEFEKLLYTYKENPVLFQKVIDKKIDCERTHSNDGRDLEQILYRFEIQENIHLQQDRFSEHFIKVENYVIRNYDKK